MTFHRDIAPRQALSFRTWQLAAILILASALVGWQLFIPPIIGLADQGDFLRVLGPLGYAPVPRGPEHKYEYVTRTYVYDPSYREPRWDQVSSEMIPARMAILLNRIFGNPGAFDITLFGGVHAVVFLLALARLLYVTQSQPMYGAIWALGLLITTDVGYVAYWNSLYTEPASCLWFLFLLAESIGIAQSSPVSSSAILRWSLFAALLITAKPQNAALCVPLAAYGVVTSLLRGKRRGLPLGSGLLASA